MRHSHSVWLCKVQWPRHWHWDSLVLCKVLVELHGIITAVLWTLIQPCTVQQLHVKKTLAAGSVAPRYPIQCDATKDKYLLPLESVFLKEIYIFLISENPTLSNITAYSYWSHNKPTYILINQHQNQPVNHGQTHKVTVQTYSPSRTTHTRRKPALLTTKTTKAQISEATSIYLSIPVIKQLTHTHQNELAHMSWSRNMWWSQLKPDTKILYFLCRHYWAWFVKMSDISKSRLMNIPMLTWSAWCRISQ